MERVSDRAQRRTRVSSLLVKVVVKDSGLRTFCSKRFWWVIVGWAAWLGPYPRCEQVLGDISPSLPSEPSFC